jgi:hypothetical protein
MERKARFVQRVTGSLILAVLSAMAVVVLSNCQSIPGGSSIGLQFQLGGGPPSYKQMQDYPHTAFDEVLINGNPVDKKDWPGVVNISTAKGSCSASVVGPRAILTAAHCAELGPSVNFTTVKGTKYSAAMTKFPLYPGQDVDIALGVTATDIDVPPMFVRLDKFETEGMPVSAHWLWMHSARRNWWQ